MKKVFYLKTCQTNKRIMAELDLSDWELQEIKSHPITEEDLQKMYEKTHSYEALFSRKSTQAWHRCKHTERRKFQATYFRTL